jgi:lambda family phage tail tape measure protein
VADLDFTIGADTAGAQRNLQRLESSLGDLRGTLNNLKGALAGLALGNFITNALNSSIAIKKMSDATGIASGSINGFAQAMSAAGGTTDRALDGISDLTKNLGDAARGSGELQKAFGLVGVSLNDLRTLSEEDILRKTVAGLAGIPDSATRSAVAMQLMGESVKGVDIAKLNRDLDGYIVKSRDLEGPMVAAQKAQQNMAIAMENFRTATLKALAPMLDFLANLKPEQVEKFVNAVVEVGVALTSIAASFKVVQGIGAAVAGLGALFVAFKTNLLAVGAAAAAFAAEARRVGIWVANLGAAISLMGGAGVVVKGLLLSLTRAFTLLLIPLGKVIGLGAAVAAAFYLIVKAVDTLFNTDIAGWFDRAGKAAADFLGISYKTEEAKKKEAAAAKQVTTEVEKTAKAGEVNRAVIDANAEAFRNQVAELQKGIDAYKNGNAELESRLKFEGSLIGLTEQQKAVRQALFDVDATYLKEKARLEELAAEKSKSAKEEDKRMIPEINKALETVTANYERQKTAVESLVEANQARLELEKQVQAISDFAYRTQQDNAKALRDIQAETAKLTMTEIEKKYYDIARAAEESARTAIAAENARRKSMGVPEMTSAEVKAYYDTAAAGVKKLQDAQKRHSDTSRSWSTGWTKAFKEYRDAAGNAAAQAENIFKKATQGMEDLIVDFVKTGKFEWKGFVQSMAEELLRGQIRDTISSVLGPIGDFFGLDLGSMGGGVKGSSANDPMYVYDIAGGGGAAGAGGMGVSGGGARPQAQQGGSDVWGSIKQGASQVWDTVKSVGTGISNTMGGVWDTVKDFGSSVWDSVSSIGSGISDFFGGFGGWFANGGTLGAGKWGIAGEAGPEIVSGPANITPMGGQGGTQYVTYNINAVDAMSFKAMVAADPSFIHAVAMQGAGSIPSRR